MRSSSYLTALLAATVLAAPVEVIPTTQTKSKRQFTLFGVEFDKRIQWSTLVWKPSLIPNVLPLLRAKYNKAEGHFTGTANAREYQVGN